MRRTIEILFLSVLFVFWMGSNSARKQFVKHNRELKTPVYHNEVHQSASKKQSTLNYLTMVDNGPASVTNVKQPGGALPPAVGNGSADDTSAIQTIINHVANSTNKKVFFPPGEYLVTNDIVINGPVELHGTQIGIAVIKASTPYANKIHNARLPVRSVVLNYLYFDGIRLEFHGGTQGQSSTSNITVDRCVFFSTAQSRVPKARAKRGQLKLAFLENSGVDKCVFLRDSNAFGVAAKFSNTVGVQVTDNICGLDLSKMNWLSSQVEPVNYWQDQKQKLEFLRTRYSLAADQGFFNSCLYDQCDKQMSIRENIFNGSPNTGNLHKDHAMYLKGFDVMDVSGNYVRGWPADASGGIKARNGQFLWLARNYIDDTGILLYTYNKSKNCLYDGLKHIIIYGNHIVQRTNPNNRTSGISYQEPLGTYGNRDEDIKYSANVFQIVNVSNPTNFSCIWLTNGRLPEHHVYEDNVYYNTSTKVKVQARNAAPSYETGAIDVAIQNAYNYTPYKLNIPPY